ncbi:MAG: hypothetical protein SNH27_17890 [Rikenellaceae bacterium]
MRDEQQHTPPKGFAVLRYFIHTTIDKDVGKAVYEKYKSKTTSKIIDKKEAQKLIKEYSLQLVVDNQYGKVWE